MFDVQLYTPVYTWITASNRLYFATCKVLYNISVLALRQALRVCFFFLNIANKPIKANQTNQLEKKYIVWTWDCFDHVTHAINGEQAF